MDTTNALKIKQTYHVEHWVYFHLDGSRCTTPHDECKEIHKPMRVWEDDFSNLVPTVGLNKYLDATLKTGLTTPAWYVGLVDNASFSAYAAADTLASHSGWLEGQPYSNATRVTWTPGTVASGSVDNSGSKAVFNINATLTVRGAFLCDNSVKATVTGTLLGAGDFSTPRIVYSGDTLTVQVTCTLTAA